MNFIKALSENKIKLAAITNHNTIDMKNYLLCKHIAQKAGINLLYGVEIDTEREDGKNFHFVALFEESFFNAFNIMGEINKKTSEKKITGKVRYSPEEIIKLIRNYNLIIVPHGDKSKGLLQRPTELEIIDALKKVRDGFIRVFDSPSDWKLERIKQFLISQEMYSSIDKFGGVLFSDNRDWLNYDLKFRDFYMNAEPTFKGFLHSISNPSHRFMPKDLISKKNNYISKIDIRSMNDYAKIADCTIYLKSGYNCIIGKSGSGKSLLLNLIKKKIQGIEDNNYKFSSNNYTELFDENDDVIQARSINIGIGASIFDRIISASESKDGNDMYKVIKLLKNDFQEKSNFNEYVLQYRKRVKDYTNKKRSLISAETQILEELNVFDSTNKELCKLKDIHSFSLDLPENTKLTYTDDKIEKIQSIYNDINSISEKIENFDNDSKNELLKNLDVFKQLFLTMYQKTLKVSAKEKYQNKKYELVNKVLATVNKGISTNANRKTEIKNDMSTQIKTIVDLISKNHLIKKRN